MWRAPATTMPVGCPPPDGHIPLFVTATIIVVPPPPSTPTQLPSLGMLAFTLPLHIGPE